MRAHRTHSWKPWPLALGGALAACTAVAGPAEPESPDPATGFHCIVMPHAVIDVSSGTDGRLDAVHVERGDTVTRHQLVAELESGVERAQVALARTRAAIDTEVRLRTAGHEVDARNAERIAALHATSLVSTQQRDVADRDASVAALRVREAREKRRLAGLELARAEEVLKMRAVRSPISGVVVDRFKWPGEFVEEDAIIRVAQLDPLRVEVILPVAEHRTLRVGQQVAIVPETEPGSRRLAAVKVVDPMADPASGTFRATLELPNPGNALLAGIKCRAHLLDPSSPAANPGSMATGDAPPEVVHDPPWRPTPSMEPPDTRPGAKPYVPRVPGSSAPRAPLRSAALMGETGRPRPSHEVKDAGVLRTAASPASEPSNVQAQACIGLGPMASAAQATRVAHKLSDAGLETSVRESRLRRANGYIVLATEAGAPHDTLQRLRQGGVRDRILLGSGEFAGRISLGIYKGPIQAERRRQDIERHGVSAEAVERTRARAAWWVDVRGSDAMTDPAALEAVLTPFAPELPASACPAAVSAAL